MPGQQWRRPTRSRVGRVLALGAAAVTVLAGMTACTASPVDPTEDCTDAGSQPPGQPGDADVLLTASGYVLYADGWMVVSADESAASTQAMRVPLMAPPDPAGDRWQPAYLGSCQLDGIDTVAAEQLVEGDLGQPMVTDASTTSVTYYGGEEPVHSSAYALEAGASDRLSRSDQQGREVLKGLMAALEEATITGEVLPVETVRVLGEVDEPEPEGWPGPPLADLLADGCGELTGEQAVQVYEYLSERTHSDVGWIRVLVVAPGQSACS